MMRRSLPWHSLENFGFERCGAESPRRSESLHLFLLCIWADLIVVCHHSAICLLETPLEWIVKLLVLSDKRNVLCVNVLQWKTVPNEWQARQATPAILQASSSKHDVKKNTITVCVCERERERERELGTEGQTAKQHTKEKERAEEHAPKDWWQYMVGVSCDLFPETCQLIFFSYKTSDQYCHLFLIAEEAVNWW